jgi:hypothetical protein
MPHTGNAISTPPKGIGLALKAVGNMADRILAFPNQCGTPPANIFHPPDIRRTARWKSSFWESEFLRTRYVGSRCRR